jgi:hypothetical protein
MPLFFFLLFTHTVCAMEKAKENLSKEHVLSLIKEAYQLIIDAQVLYDLSKNNENYHAQELKKDAQNKISQAIIQITKIHNLKVLNFIYLSNYRHANILKISLYSLEKALIFDGHNTSRDNELLVSCRIMFILQQYITRNINKNSFNHTTQQTIFLTSHSGSLQR